LGADESWAKVAKDKREKKRKRRFFIWLNELFG
jgi:hypothetical protein